MLCDLPVEAIQSSGAALEIVGGVPAKADSQPTAESIAAIAIEPMRRVKAKYRRRLSKVSNQTTIAINEPKVLPVTRPSAFRTVMDRPGKTVTFKEGTAMTEAPKRRFPAETPFAQAPPCKTLSQLGAFFANHDRSLCAPPLPLNAAARMHLARTARNTQRNALEASALRLGKRSRAPIVVEEDLFRPAVKVKFTEGADRSTVDNAKDTPTLTVRPKAPLILSPGTEVEVPLPGSFSSTDPAFAVQMRPAHHRVALTVPYDGETTVRICNRKKKGCVTLSVTEPFLIITLKALEERVPAETADDDPVDHPEDGSPTIIQDNLPAENLQCSAAKATGANSVHLPLHRKMQKPFKEPWTLANKEKVDWKLNPEWFTKFDALFGPHTIDLFSGPNNGQLSRRYSVTQGDSGATGQDAFAHSWTGENAWANPPYEDKVFWKLIDKAIMDQATVTVVAPLWKHASWYRRLLLLSCDYPRLLPHSPDLFFPGPTNDKGVGWPPWAETMVVRISGDGATRAAFAQRLLKEPFLPTVRAATFYPNGRKLPFFSVTGRPIKWDARVHASSAVTQPDARPPMIGEETQEDEEGYEVIQLGTLAKAYALIGVGRMQHCCLFDTGSQGDIMSWGFYKKHFAREFPLRRERRTVQGFHSGTVTMTEGIARIRLRLGDRKVVVPFWVIPDTTDDMLIGQPTMRAIGIDIKNTESVITVRPRKGNQPFLLPILGAPKDRTMQEACTRQEDQLKTVLETSKLRALDTVSIAPWTAAWVEAPVPHTMLGQTIFVESLPSSAGVHVLKGILVPAQGTILVNVANMTRTTRVIPAGKAFGVYSPLDMTEVSVVQLDGLGTPVKDDAAMQVSSAAQVARYAQTRQEAEGTTESETDTTTVAKLRQSRQHLDWEDIPETLNVGKGLDEVTDDQLAELLDLIRAHTRSGLFSKQKNPGQVHPDIALHRIDTGNAKPINFPPRRQAPAKRKAIEKETAEMLEWGVIEPSRSPWAAPVVIAPKKDGGLRFCVDYRELNKVTKKDVYPLPRIDDTVDALNGAQFLSAFDLLSGYWQVGVAQEDREKTAFVTHEGLFQWTCMPFGLTGAPATFQRMMDTVLAGLKWQCCLVYLDDVVVFSRTFEQHVKDLRIVFDRLAEAGLKLKPSKCFFCCTELLYLGYLVTPQGLKPDPTTKRAILEFPAPRDVSAVRTFMGMTGHYRQFIKDYAMIVKPIHDLTKPNRQWDWTKECQQAFDRLKEIMTSPPVLKLPDFTRKFQFTLQTDASDQGLGAVLSQKAEDGLLHPVAFASRRLTDAELKYHTQEKEALGIIWACEKFRPYLLGETFDVETDHGSLKWLLGTQKGRLARWAMRLSEFDLTIKPKPGTANGNADAPSRYPVDDADPDWSPDRMPQVTDLLGSSSVLMDGAYALNMTTETAARITVVNASQAADAPPDFTASATRIARLSKTAPSVADHPVDGTDVPLRAQLIRAQRRDQELLPVIEYLKGEVEAPPPTSFSPGQLAKMQLASDELLLIETPLFIPGEPLRKRRRTATRTGLRSTAVSQKVLVKRAVVPTAMRETLLRMAHSCPLAGHLGKNRVYDTLMRSVFWKGLSTDVKEFIRSCEQCQRFKRAPRPWLKPLTTIKQDEPFGSVAMDLVVNLPVTASGARHIAVFTCMFTKWVEAAPLKDKTADSVADALYTHIICRHGVPKKVQSDQGTEFVNATIARLAQRMDILHQTTTPYNPQSNGAVERYNATLIDSLRKYVFEENQMNWDFYLPSVLFAYNASKHASTQFTPFELVYGRRPRLPLSILQSEEEHTEFTRDLDEYGMRHAYELNRAHKCVRAILQDAREAYKAYYDSAIPKSAKQPPFAVGDEVMLFSPRLATCGDCGTSSSPKFKPKWNGPFAVVDVSRTGDVFTIRNEEGRTLKVKVEDLKLYHARRVKPASPDSNRGDSHLGDKDTHRKDRLIDETSAAEEFRKSDVGKGPSATGARRPGLRPKQPPPAQESPFQAKGSEAAEDINPNRSFEVDRILSHRRFGRQFLYLVRWAPPYDGKEHDCEVNARAFDKKPGDKIAPALREYWLQVPAHLRPVAYRRLGKETPAEGKSIAKRRRGRSATENGEPTGTSGDAPCSSAAPVQNRAKRRRQR